MAELTQDNRPMAVETPVGKDTLLLVSVLGTEELSENFEYVLDMQSEDEAIDASQLVGEPLTFRIDAGDEDGSHVRYFNGYVSEFTHVGWANKLSTYRATVVPWLWFLDQTADCRIFQEKSVKDIVTQIFDDLGFTDFRWEVKTPPPKREYCVQYRETDFNFVSRLLEEEGIFYFFDHEDGKHTLVLADSAQSFVKMNDDNVICPEARYEGRINQVTDWQHKFRFRTGKYAHTDYNFKKPSTPLMGEQAAQKLPFKRAKNFEVYDYHGRHEDPNRSRALAKIRMEEIEASHDVGHGQSTCGSFMAGGKFTFEEHRTRAEEGNTYAISRVQFQAVNDNYAGSGGASFSFSNRFECIPIDVPFRPARRARKPVVEGPQTAVIVGPPEERSIDGIHVDEYSRVKAQFHWDREHDRDDTKCCWMRVSQAHAGKGWGYVDIPRVNEEVIVDFIEGDPDRPIITGRVYNGEVMPPYTLSGSDNAKNKTRRGNSTKTYGADGYNEVTMDDTPGEEQLRMNAQYDMNSNVNNDQTLDVGNDQTEKVVNNRTREVGVNETITVGADKSVTVKANHMENVKANQNITVDANQTNLVKANQSTTVNANQTNSIGVNQSISVGKMKNETVGMMANEMVGIAKTTNVGVANSIIAGAVMNTAVGVMSTEQVGSTKKITVGSKFEISCGSSKLTMESGGKVTITGSEFNFSASGPVKINGAIIDLN